MIINVFLRTALENKMDDLFNLSFSLELLINIFYFILLADFSSNCNHGSLGSTNAVARDHSGRRLAGRSQLVRLNCPTRRRKTGQQSGADWPTPGRPDSVERRRRPVEPDRRLHPERIDWQRRLPADERTHLLCTLQTLGGQY